MTHFLKKNLIYKKILIFSSLIIVGLLSSGCATWEGVKQDSQDGWDKTKDVSEEAWDATKEGAGDAWKATKSAVHDATED